MKKLITAAILIVIVTILAFTGFAYYYKKANNTTINMRDEYFILNKDISLEEGAETLEGKSFIQSKKAFIYYSKHYKLQDSFKAGNYIINPRTPIKELLLKLQSGKSDFAKVTIPEGYSLFKIASTLEKKDLINKDELLNTALEDLGPNSLIIEKPGVNHELEGYLYPDTYYIPITATKSDIIELLYGNFTKVFSETYRARANELGLSVNEVITIASLIEKEAANDEERSMISGVIYNRLKIDMPLQIDATVVYANTLGESSLNPITKAHLKKDSKYNTYVYKGLPPGPIASPGKPSIEAALYPESHEYLYYVLGPKGHVFSKTYQEHLQNVKKYLK